MKKRATAEPSVKVVKLKTTKVDFFNLKEKANSNARHKGRQPDMVVVAIDKQQLANLIGDYEALLRSLKNLGGFFRRDLDYSESAEWKQSIGKPLRYSEVPAFLKPTNRRRERL